MMKKKLTFDPHASNVPIPLQDLLIDEALVLLILKIRLHDEAAEVNPRLDRHNGSCRQRASDPQVPEHPILVLVIRVASRIVGIHTQIMPEPVREKGDTDPLLQQFGHTAVFEDAALQESRDGDPVRQDMDVLPLHPRADQRKAGVLHPLDNGVHLRRFLGETSRQGQRARHVRAVAIVFGRGVDEQVQFAVSGFGVREREGVLNVMQGRGVGAGAEDAMIGLFLAAGGDT